MKMKYYIWVLLVITFASCRNNSGKVNDSVALTTKHEKVMEIHDEVMPEMGPMRKLRKKLKKIGSEDPQVAKAINKLLAADEFMMDWMADYKIPEGSDSIKSKYLDGELKKVNELKAAMLEAISNAESTIALKNKK